MAEAAPAGVAEVNGVNYASLQEAVDAAPKNATVKLLADTKENVTISTPYVTLDLNGYTLNGGTEKGKPALTVTARVTVKDSSEAKTGTIMREDTAENSGVSSHYVIDIQGSGWLTFESGNVTNNSGNESGKGASLVRVGNDSVAKYPGLNIKGGNFTQNNFIVIKVDSGDLFLNGGTLNSTDSYAIENWHRATVKGGTVNGAVAAWTYSGGHNSDLAISGGTVNGDVKSVTYDGAEGKTAKVSITGGVVNGTLDTVDYSTGTTSNDPTKATIEVTGGTFSTNPSRYLIEGSAATQNSDGKYGVEKAYLAQVGETSYYTMDEAIKAQTASGEAITLLRDYTTGSTFSSGTVARVVDLNGHTWTCTGTDANSAAFEINNPNASLTVKNGKVVSSQLVGLIPSAMGGTITYDNSTLTFEGVEASTTATSGIETNGNNTSDTVVLKNSTLNVPNGFGIYFPSSGTLTIDNSTINAKTMGVQVCSGDLNVNAGSKITVSGDPVAKTEGDGAIQDGAAISIVNRPGYKGLGQIAITGGTFTAKDDNAAIKAYTWDSSTKQESAFDNSAKTVAVYGGTFSSSVPEALCAEGCNPVENPDGTHGVSGSVAQVGFKAFNTLQAAIDAAQDGETVTLLADATEDATISAGKSITLDLGGKTLTNTNAGKATISVQGGTVTVKNGNVVGGTGYYNIEVTKGSNANLTLADVTATAGNNGSAMIDNHGTLTITSGTYTGGLDTVKNEPNAKLTITGGAFTLTKGTSKGFTGVVFNYGDLTISGGEFIQSDKSAPYGQAQVVHTDKSGNAAPSTVISGGTFKNLCTRSTAWTVRATNAADGATKVSGGAFNKKVYDSYCADGLSCVKNADGTYGVAVAIAQIGSVNYASLQDAINAAKSRSTVKLLTDIVLDAQAGTESTLYPQFTISGKKLTLDMQGHKISYSEESRTKNYGKASLLTLSIDKGSDVTITGNGTIDTELGSNQAYGINILGGSNLTINNGTFYGAMTAVQVQKGGLVINDGTFLMAPTCKEQVPQYAKYIINCIDAAWKDGSATVSIKGGTFGHDYSHSPEGEGTSYLAPGYAPIANADGTYGVVAGVAQIGTKAYATLADAVAAAQDGDMVQLLGDVEQNTQLTIDKNITLDLNGKTIKNTQDIWGDNANAILSITNGAKVTITGNGTIDAKENDCYTINVVKGDLTIENGTFYGNVSVVQVQEGTLSVKGGTFDLHQKWEGSSKYLFNCIDDAYANGSANVAISGGTFVGFDPSVSPEGEGTSYLAPGYAPTDNGDGTYGVVAGVAQIGTKAYATLAGAVAAAQDGDTITLLSDCSGDGISIKDDTFPNGLTIDFSGHSYTVGGKLVGSSGTASNGFHLLKGNTIVMRNGSIYGDASVAGDDTTQWSGSPAIMIQNYSNLTLDGMTVKGGKQTCYTLSNNNGDTVIKDSTIIAGQNTQVGGPFAFDVCRYASYPSVSVTVEGNSVIDGCVEVSGAIGEGQNRQLTITGGTFSKPISVSTQPANIAISGGTFATEIPAEHCAAGYAPTDNGDGTYGVKLAEGAYLLQDYRSGDQASWMYPTQEGMAFAGWYKDASFTTPCAASDVEGAAYAKFVPITDLLKFKGGSLRMDKGVPSESTYLRFGYTKAIPEGTTYIENGWYYKRLSAPTSGDRRLVAYNNALNNDGTITSNLVFNGVAKNYYTANFTEKAFVKYMTVDGTTVEAVEDAYHSRSVSEVADAILAHPMASEAEKDYATSIKSAIQ